MRVNTIKHHCSCCWLHSDLQFSPFCKTQICGWRTRYADQATGILQGSQKNELIEFSIRTGAPAEVTENLQELEDDGAPYESIEEIWPDYPTKDDFFFNEDEY